MSGQENNSSFRNGAIQAPRFGGAMVAIVTPMKLGSSNEIDIPKLEALVEWHINEGTAAIVAVGTTGESPTLTEAEWATVVSTCVNTAKHRIPVIAGTGTNNTQQTIEKTKKAQLLGADAAMVVAPYYNKPSQEGLYQHFKAVAESVPIFPIILYNVPSRTVVSIDPGTTARLAKIPNVVGIKDASRRIYELLVDGSANHLSANFAVISGEDALACDAMLAGASGVISVACNIFPRLYSKMCVAATTGMKEEALALNEVLAPLYDVLFIEPSPAVPKFQLKRMNMIEDGTRLPLLALTAENEEKVATACNLVDDYCKKNLHQNKN